MQSLIRRNNRAPSPRLLVLAMALASAILLLFPLTASAAGVLDQEVTTAATNQFEYTFGGGQYSAAQTFTAGLTGTLTEVDVRLLGDGYPLTVKVEGVNSDGSPNDGDVLDSTTSPGLPGLGWLPITVSAPSTAGTQYAIVLSAPSASASEPWYMGSSYSGGSDWQNDGSGWSGFGLPGDSTFLFKTYVTGPPVSTSTGVSPASVAVGASTVQLSASVTASQAVSEGKVTFTVTNSSNQQVGAAVSAPVDANGDATASYALPADTPIGAYTISAGYVDTQDAVANFSTSTGTQTLQITDNVPPTTTAALNGYTAGAWTNQSVQVNLSAIDNPNPGGSGVVATYYSVDNPACTATVSGLASCATYSEPFTVDSDGRHTVTYFSVDNAGNIEAAQTLTVDVDTTPPAITATVTPAPASTGWYNASTGAPTVTFTCSDALSGVALCPGPHLFGEGVNQGYAGWASDNAGNSNSASASGINVDLTAPAVSYVGNAGSYAANQQVSITCRATDSLSGLASTTCRNINGPAYSFGLGTHGYSATATDNAGNTGSGQTSFTVTDTPSSVDALIGQFCTSSSVAASLVQDVSAISTATNSRAKAGALASFVHLVQAQTGKSLTLTQAQTLITLADAL